MRALSERQASRCETAKNKTCKCRCGGVFHGSMRNLIEEDREVPAFFEQLDEDDPHHVRSPEEKKKRAKIRRRQTQAPLQTTLWEELT